MRFYHCPRSELLDASDSMANFEHRMNFSAAEGFTPCEPLPKTPEIEHPDVHLKHRAVLKRYSKRVEKL